VLQAGSEDAGSDGFAIISGPAFSILGKYFIEYFPRAPFSQV
jgi:hypothetical protein